MTTLEKAKNNVAKMKRMKKAAEERLRTAEQTGSEKQIENAERILDLWIPRLETAKETLKVVKAGMPGINFKKVTTFTGLAVMLTGLVIIGGYIIGKKQDDQDIGEVATDTV